MLYGRSWGVAENKDPEAGKQAMKGRVAEERQFQAKEGITAERWTGGD